jgi:hypothetical protein
MRPFGEAVTRRAMMPGRFLMMAFVLLVAGKENKKANRWGRPVGF